ncbi:MAG: hypothetical protein M0R03_14565 [Novosphingobium sp.]|nr:hypothetical protein [Novosphingobium sp.]
MRIAIDLNDVIRNFTGRIEEIYCKYINENFNIYDVLEESDGDFRKILPFKTKIDYFKFLYEDYPLEIFGNATFKNKRLVGELNMWLSNLENEETKKPVEVIIVCPNEQHLSIQATCFFLSKFIRVRKVLFPTNSKEVWDSCDVLITANPTLIKTKPKTKKLIKIQTEYNKKYTDIDYSFKNLNDFIEYTVEKSVIELRDRCVDALKKEFSSLKYMELKIGSFTDEQYKELEEKRKNDGKELKYKKEKLLIGDTILEIRFYLQYNDVLTTEDIKNIKKFVKNWYKNELAFRNKIRKMIFK